jgi:hypothetical protein
MNTNFILTREEINALPTVEPSDQEKADRARVDREIAEENKRPRPNGGILIPVFE